MADKPLNIETKLDNITLMLAGIAGSITDKNGETGLQFKNFKTIQALNRMGLASKILDSYSFIVVNRETSMSVAVHGSITGATVDEHTFVTKMESAETKDYEFIYDGSAWHFGGQAVSLSEYGISVTGTPSADDTIVIHETAEAKRYDVLDIDHDVPSDPNLEHTITLCSHDTNVYGSLAYKRPQGLIYVDPTAFPNGLTAGELYYVTSVNGAYDLSTSEDGMFGIVPPHDVPADGLLSHSAIGGSRSTYAKATVLAGTWTTYGTRANGRQQIDTGIATVDCDGESGTNLGTVTGEDYSKRTQTYLNMTRRNAYGSNKYIDSDERGWMNSEDPKGIQTNGMYKWQHDLGIFDLPSTFNSAGNLYGMDPSLLEVIGKVRKRTYVHAVDRTDQSVKYVDTDELVFPLSMNEAGLGTTNDGVYENAVNRDNTVKTTAYAYYARRTTNAERVKYQNGSARDWWVRSPYPSLCHDVRFVVSDGSLGYRGAYYTCGAVDAYNIV